MGNGEFQPALTYPEPDGTATAGHSGTNTSRDRARTEVSTRKVVHAQSIVLAHIIRQGPDGRTVAELRRALPQMHHGSISSALTNLHRAGQLDCLTDKRDRCHIYVVPEFTNGRATRPAGRTQPRTRKAGAEDQQPSPVPQIADLGIADWVYAADMTDAYEEGYNAGRDEAWQRGYDEGVAAAQKRPGALLEAKHEGMLEGRKQQAARTMALVTNLREQMKGKGPIEPHTTTCWMKHPRCALDAVAKAQMIR